MKFRLALGSLIASSVALTAIFSFAQSKEVPVKDVPAKVADAVKAKWPKVKITHAETQKEAGKVLYNLELTEGTGKQARKFGASLAADGKIDEVQEPANLADVPKPILAALAKKYPVVKKPHVDKITEGEGASAKVMYEFRLGIQARFDSTGKTLDEIEIELDDGKEE